MSGPTSETIRAFVAVELPSCVEKALANLSKYLRKASVRGLQLIRPNEIHLTIKFLGNVSSNQVGRIASSLVEVTSAHHSFKLELGSAGIFPHRKSPRVLWVGVSGDLTALQALHDEIEATLASMGFPKEERTFSPHLTVARLRKDAPVQERTKATESLLSTRTDLRLPIKVSHLSLMQSTLLPTGATYERLALLPLGD